MANKLHIWDQRVLDFIDYCSTNNIAGIKDEHGFIKKIGIKTQATLTQIRMGKASFRIHHLQKIGQVFGVSMDYLLGFSENRFRNDKPLTAVETLQEATRRVVLEYDKQKKVTVNKAVNSRAKKTVK